jgi:hypothetical protein
LVYGFLQSTRLPTIHEIGMESVAPRVTV